MSVLCASMPAGSNKRRYNVCATCLQGWDDELHPFTEELAMILRHLLYDFDLDGCLKLVPAENGLKLCDMCLKTLQDIYFFKQKASKSLSQLKHQWEYFFQSKQTGPNTSQCPPDDKIVVTPKLEVKEETEPLEIVFTQTTSVLLESVDIKEENHLDKDHTNAEKNSDAESTDSEDLDANIDKNSIPKTLKLGTDVNRANDGSEYGNSLAIKANITNFNAGNERKLSIDKSMNSYSMQNGLGPMICITPCLGATSDSSHLPVKIETIGRSNVGQSTHPVDTIPRNTSQVRRNTAAKGKTDMQTRIEACSDTNSDSGDTETKPQQQYTVPWYITDITREQLVKIREDLLKDPCFAEATYKCTYCGQTFGNREHWNYHNTQCCGKSKENGEFSCFACSLSFDTLSLLSAHMRFHSHGHHTYQCSTCEYTTKDTYSLNRHRCTNKGGEKVPPKDPNMKLGIGRRQYYCPACDYVSYNLAVNPHYQRAHTTAVKCDVCDRSLKSLGSLKKHKTRHHSGKPRPEKKEVMFCAPCVKSFYDMRRYREHMMTFKHASKDQIKISCDECPKKFHLQEVYEKHKRSHELIRSGTKPFKCTHCGLSYILKKTLVAHIRSKHTEREVKRNHVCEVCGSAYTSATILRKHMVCHSGERPYKCEHCGETFKYSGSMYTHINQIHKKNKPDDGKKGSRKTAKGRKRRMNKGDEHEQSGDTHEHEQKTKERENILETNEHEQIMDS